MMRRWRDSSAGGAGRHMPRLRAFTLAEVLATLAVLAIVLPVAMGAVSQAMRVASVTHQKALAMELAQQKLNDLVASGDYQTATLSGDFGTDHPGYTWDATANAWSQSDVTDLEEVSVTVKWKNRGNEQSVALTTLVYTGAGVTTQ